MTTLPNLPQDPFLPELRWNSEAKRYINDRGQFVSQSAVKSALSDVLDDINSRISTDSAALRTGEIRLAEWQTRMMTHIKDSNIIGGAMQKGGYYNMTQSDFGRVGQIVRQEYGYLRNFANEIASGQWPLDGRLDNRARQYGQAGWQTYHNLARNEAIEDEFTEVQSNRNSRDGCRECIALDGKWFPIESSDYIPTGSRICRSNCRCSERYRKGSKVRDA